MASDSEDYEPHESSPRRKRTRRVIEDEDSEYVDESTLNMSMLGQPSGSTQRQLPPLGAHAMKRPRRYLPSNIEEPQPVANEHQSQSLILPSIQPYQCDITALESIRIAGYTLRDANLIIPAWSSRDQRESYTRTMQKILQNLKDNPPVLPASQIPDLPNKPFADRVRQKTDSTGTQKLKSVDQFVIADKTSEIDRERNNMAAKKSRQTRVESLNNALRMIQSISAKCTWLMMRMAISGVDAAREWDNVPPHVKSGLEAQIEDYIREIEKRRVEEKKARELIRRKERNKQRAVLQAESASVQEEEKKRRQLGLGGDTTESDASGDSESELDDPIEQADTQNIALSQAQRYSPLPSLADPPVPRMFF